RQDAAYFLPFALLCNHRGRLDNGKRLERIFFSAEIELIYRRWRQLESRTGRLQDRYWLWGGRLCGCSGRWRCNGLRFFLFASRKSDGEPKQDHQSAFAAI